MNLNTISKLIKQNIWEIIDVWQESILSDKGIQSSHLLSKQELISSMPIVLLAVAENIVNTTDEEITRDSIFGQKVSKQSKTRLKQGYSLTEIFREYIFLRQNILFLLKSKNSISKTEYLLHSRLNKAIDEQLLNAIETYANHYTKQLKKEAATDPLTGILNRRAFFDSLNKELNRAKRYNHAIALLIIDLDHFKKLNDELGHLAGDKYLINFANFLTNKSRETDYVSRIGGDEFALLLPETTMRQATEVIQRIQLSFKKTPQLKSKTGVGVSIGIGINGHFDAIEMYKAADKALFKSKQRKNRVILQDKKHRKRTA